MEDCLTSVRSLTWNPVKHCGAVKGRVNRLRDESQYSTEAEPQHHSYTEQLKNMTTYHLLKSQLIQYYNFNFCYGYNHDESDNQ